MDKNENLRVKGKEEPQTRKNSRLLPTNGKRN